MLTDEEEALPLTLFISFNPKTECGQKFKSFFLLMICQLIFLYSGYGVRIRDTDTSLLCSCEKA